MFGKNTKQIYLVAGIADALDFMLIGEIPVIGDLIDLAVTFYLYTKIGSYAGIAATELLSVAEFTGVGAPLALLDILPLNLAAVVIWDAQTNGGSRK